MTMMKTRIGAAFALAICFALGGCASGAGGQGSGGGSSVEVFGVIDAGVSHTTNKSSRR